MIEPNWDLYRTLLAVLAYGSLSAAARELGLTQPTVGRHIEALEGSLGQQLFTRSQQGLAPTEAALALKPYAELIAATSAALVRAASGDRDRVSGTVRISASEMIGIAVLPPILAKLQDRHPELVIELSTTDAVENILHREADIAIRMAEPTQNALVARHVGAIPIGFHAHRDYLERHGMPQAFEDLARHRLIGFDRGPAYLNWMIEKWPWFTEFGFSFRADSNLAQLAAVRAGLGIGMCQIQLVADEPDIVRVLPDGIEIPLHTWVVMHEDLKTSPRCRATFDALVEGLLEYCQRAGRIVA
jgi:DNA-binding transcriptional LysR family regulator